MVVRGESELKFLLALNSYTLTLSISLSLNFRFGSLAERLMYNLKSNFS
jgi:hypothetical protein